MTKYRRIMGHINYWLFLAVVALLPFPQAPLRLVCVMWIVSWFLEARWLSKPEFRSPIISNIAIPFLCFGLWYAWHAVSGLWAADHAAWAWQMERYMTFGLLVPVGIWGLNNLYDWRQACRVLIWSCMVAVPFYIIAVTAFYLHPEWLEYFQWREPWEYELPQNWIEFFGENISQIKHRLFLCSVELFGAVMAWQLWRNEWKKLLPALLIMLSVIPLTGSRQAVMTFAVLLAIIISFELPQRFSLRYSVFVMLMGIALGSVLLKYHPRMQDFHITDITEMRTISEEHDVRFNVWGVALRHPSDYMLHGLGGGQSTEYMLAGYQQMGRPDYCEKKFNSHNQYLEETIELGIFGLLFFVLIWVTIPLAAKNKGRQTAILLFALFVLNMFTDCMFGRFCGIALWAVGLLLILLQSDPKREQ